METVVDVPNSPRTLGEFIQHEIDKRGLSNREFAKLVGVSHRTIDKFLDQSSKQPVSASFQFLMKLSKATSTNMLILIALAYPEMQESLVEATGLGARALLRNQRIEQLDENMREAVDTIIFQRTKNFGQGNNDV